MKKSVEIFNRITEKKAEMKSLRDAGKINEAYAMIEEIKSLQSEYEIELELEKPELPFGDEPGEAKAKGNGDAMLAFNKAVKGQKLTDAELALVENTGKSGGYLVPTEEVTRIEELKRSMGNLKQYCDVVPVNTLSGTYVVEVSDDGKLITFDEDGEVSEGDIEFAKKNWTVETKGLLIPVNNRLLDDEQANLMSYIDRYFAKAATRTDNADIVAVLKQSDTVEGESYKAINKTLNVELDPAISDSAIIITNQSGYDYLDTLEDMNGRPLLKDSLTQPGGKVFAGKRVITLTDKEYTAEEGTREFWVGDMFSAVKFMDRKSLEVAISEHAAFKANMTLVRCIQRGVAVSNDKDAGRRIVITVAEE
jgi:HK97 family phage major capsid protein